MSLGIVLLEPEDSVSAADVLARADLAMYKAKRAGKGRARVYGGAAGSRRAMIVPQRTPDSS